MTRSQCRDDEHAQTGLLHGGFGALVEEHGIELRRFPEDVLATLREHATAVMDDLAANDPTIAHVHDSYRAFAAMMGDWHEISEGYYSRMRQAQAR